MGSAFPGGATAHGRGWVAVQGRCRRARWDQCFRLERGGRTRGTWCVHGWWLAQPAFRPHSALGAMPRSNGGHSRD